LDSDVKGIRSVRLSHGNQAPPLASRDDLDAIGNTSGAEI